MTDFICTDDQGVVTPLNYGQPCSGRGFSSIVGYRLPVTDQERLWVAQQLNLRRNPGCGAIEWRPYDVALTVTLDINGEKVRRLTVTNKGQTPGGLTTYRWDTEDGRGGSFLFDRKRGADALAAEALDQLG